MIQKDRKQIETFSDEFQEVEFQAKSKTEINWNQTLRNTRRNLTSKSVIQPHSYSRSRMIKIKRIEENLASLFKQNQTKLHLYFNDQSPIFERVNRLNLENPEIYTIFQDGVYVLIEGSIKMIGFEEERSLPKATMKEIITGVFRKLKAAKESGTKSKDSLNQSTKKPPQNEKGPCFYSTCSLEQPFSVFECVNQNSCCFSAETILYKLDEQELKMFRYYENKQKIRRFLEEYRSFFKTNFLLYQTLAYKKFNFRNEFKVDNVALLKKGTLKVFYKQVQASFKLGAHSSISKKLVCELCEPSLLTKDFHYEISSCEAQIIFVHDNQSFQFVKNPEWVSRFQSKIKTKQDIKDSSKKIFKKKSSHTIFKKPMSKLSHNQSAFNILMCNHQIFHTNTDETVQKFQEEENIRENQKLKIQIHRKSISDLNKISKQSEISRFKQALNQKVKKSQMLKTISPYVLISQTTGLKEIKKTRSILNERISKMSHQSMDSTLKLTKVSKSHLKKYQHSSLNPMEQQKLSMYCPNNKSRILGKFYKFYNQKNQKQQKENRKENRENHDKFHRKSSSGLIS